MRTFSTFLGLTAAALTLLATANPSFSDERDTVIDDRSNIIVNTFGNCVRTKWNANNDECAPAPAPAPQPVAQPAPPPPAISLEQRTVYFDFDDATLNAEAVNKLNTLATIVRANPQIIKADIIGYADQMGDSDYNVALSQRRADAVDQYLSQLITVDTSVLEIRGLGESNSVTNCAGVTNRTEKIACLAADRRVEVQFKYMQR